MKHIYIILSQSGTEVSKMLKLFTKEKYNHSSICIDETFNEFYSFGRKNVNFPIPGGFLIENAFTHVFGKFKNIPCMILEKEVTDEQYDKLKEKINYFIENKDKLSYAFISLVFTNTKYSIINNTKFFCSQFVAKVLNDISIETPKSPEHMRPMDFTKVEEVRTIFEGDLKNFCLNKKAENRRFSVFRPS